MEVSSAAAEVLATLREVKGYDKPLLPPGTEALLRVMSVLTPGGEMTRAEMREATEMSPSSIGAATRLGEAFGVLHVEQQGRNRPKVYSPAPDAWDRIHELAPDMVTFMAGIERADRAEESVQRYCERQLENARRNKRELDPAEEQRLKRRRAKAIECRRALCSVIYSGWTPDQIERHIQAPTVHPLPAAARRMERRRAEYRIAQRQQKHDERELLTDLPRLRAQAYAEGD